MKSSEDLEEGDNWVTYGSAFSDDDTEQGRQRALYFGKRLSVPTAYEQRVLNEKGRPMRFHGAFTGGFSAGYFNTVGSKEGFKPGSFHSSRKDRTRDKTERQMVQRPEDFMDDEDFGEHGIAPRRIRMADNFDDTHIHDTMKAALGGQSVIPASSELLKSLIIPSKGPLAERLLRKMGWRNPTASLDCDETLDRNENDDSSDAKTGDIADSGKPPPDSALCLFAKISFEAKTNTFGLGYSGLNPDVAMGRQLPRPQSAAPWDQLGDRHPEESSTALARRQQAIQSQPGFNPHIGPSRSGIRGQAFGVGALETEDSDIYAQDKLIDYDWEIGGEPSSAEDEDEEDAEQAELEAARTGRLSFGGRRSTPMQSSKRRCHQSGRTIDGWTAPTYSRYENKSASGSVSGMLPGFAPASDSNERDRLMPAPPMIRLPPGYMPVFNPQCIRDPTAKPSSTDKTNGSNQLNGPTVIGPLRGRLDVASRAQLLNDSSTDSVLKMISPVEQLRMKAAAVGLPVPKIAEGVDTSVVGTVPCIPDLTQSLKTDALLKPFKSDSAKQARFDAFQVLVRRGFTNEEAYTRCSGGVDLNGEERERELNSFQTIIRTARPSSGSKTAVDSPSADISFDGTHKTPLTNRLPLHKQQLVASILASRFRSAGCMDISKELSESEEKAERAKVESLETVEPRDHAVATESYGALTRRRLEWHPDHILCKRVNVPNPYPDSTFVGCPDERRPHHQPWRRGHRNRWSDRGKSNEFSLFDLLDVNRGTEQDPGASDSEGDSPSPTKAETDLYNTSNGVDSQPQSTAILGQPQVASTVPHTSLFSVLFHAAASAPGVDNNHEISAFEPIDPPKTSDEGPSSSSLTSTVDASGPRRLGPSLPAANDGFRLDSTIDEDDSRPPMDLFKSIFASDEELSDSDTDESPPAPAQFAIPSATTSAVESRVQKVSQAEPSSLFAHLFESTSDLEAPLSGFAPFAQITNSSSSHESRQRPPDKEPDPQFVHGPALPPTLDPESQPTGLVSPSKSNPVTQQSESNAGLKWVVGSSESQSGKSRRHHRHRHHTHGKRSKHKEKNKSKRKHKSRHKRTRKSQHAGARSCSSPESISSGSSSTDSD
ncbi:G patch domain-containing protein 1 [Fasciola hepatica]|uniref:G patch domain-containing protein 1 n=1 Tax=Fasciola hepatica TaxID=6192 RepID=A0A4E0RMU0_FASHE|nr:G patch domain-containing protein 1 [Fasciola hepatica]